MSVAALTTTFVPASSCLDPSNIWKLFTSCPGLANCGYFIQGPPSTTDCLPSAYRPDSTAYYSPGHCPSGYTVACQSIQTINTYTETAQTCCPTAQSFTCHNNPAQVASFPFLSSLGCETVLDTTLTVTVSSAGSTTLTTASLNGGLNAYAIQVRFQASDFVSTTSTPGPTSIPATPAQSISSTTPTSSSTSAPSNSSGLSSGAKAGIGIGVAAGVLALLAVLWLGYMWGKRRSRTPLYQYPVEDNYASNYPPSVYKRELEAPPAELEGQVQHHELGEEDLRINRK